MERTPGTRDPRPGDPSRAASDELRNWCRAANRICTRLRRVRRDHRCGRYVPLRRGAAVAGITHTRNRYRYCVAVSPRWGCGWRATVATGIQPGGVTVLSPGTREARES